MHSGVKRAGTNPPDLAQPHSGSSIGNHCDTLRNQQRHRGQTREPECALPAHSAERARHERGGAQCSLRSFRRPPKQPAQLRRNHHVIHHQGARAAKQPDTQNHQQILQNQHGTSPSSPTESGHRGAGSERSACSLAALAGENRA